MLKNENFMNIAYEVAKGSKCVSRHTGAVIVLENRILSMGYNGTPSGYINCCDHFKGVYGEDHHEWSYKYETHAEMNAIIWAARQGIEIEGSIMYCTYEPCFDCIRAIIGAGIKEIYYSEKYKHHENKDAEHFLKKCNIKITHLPLKEETK